MKKIIIVFCFLGILQSSAQVTFKPGIQAGVNLSKITNSNLNSKTDFYIGAFGALKLGKFYTLQHELTYSRQGGNGTMVTGYKNVMDEFGYYDQVPVEGNVNVSLQYFSDIVINKFNFNKNIYLLVGPFLDIILKDKISMENSNTSYPYVSKGQDVDFGIIGGFGYSLPKGVSIEARIKKGMIDALDNNYSSSYNDLYGETNFVIQIGATYTFGKK